MAPSTIFEKLAYRLSLVYSRIICKGNYYDKSNYWEYNLLKHCRIIIKRERINNLICSVGPFRSAYFLVKLKEEFPELNYIVDYRDPWTNNETSFGFTSLTKKRFEHELQLEKKVLQKADMLTAVSKEMGEYFSNFVDDTVLRKKFFVISNGFDTEDLPIENSITQFLNSEKVNIVFAGSFYVKAFHVFRKLVESILSVEDTFPEKRGKIHFTFLGSIIPEMQPY